MGNFIERMEERLKELKQEDFVEYPARRMGNSYLAEKMKAYIIGHDPYKESGEGSISVSMIDSHLKLIGELKKNALTATGIPNKYLNNVKQEEMKRKNFYHTFEFEGRTVTLCLAVREEAPSFFRSSRSNTATTHVGYAVCVPEDTFSEELAKRISLGRAESEKANIEVFATRAPLEFAFDLGMLNATAKIWERKIKRGEVVIKGIRKDVE